MCRTDYKNHHKATHYDRIELAVPKGMKAIIKNLAADKEMSVNAYIQDLIRKDQEGLFDTMQIADKNKELLSGIEGNMHDGYNAVSYTHLFVTHFYRLTQQVIFFNFRFMQPLHNIVIIAYKIS